MEDIYSTLWSKLKDELNKQTSWGKNQLLDMMNKMELQALRDGIKTKSFRITEES